MIVDSRSPGLYHPSLRPGSAGVIIVSQMRLFSPVVALIVLAGPFAVEPAGAAVIQAPSMAAADATAGYYFLLGRRLEDDGKTDAAITALKKAIELEPGSAEVRAELAGVYARHERTVEAVDTAEAALQRD